MKRNLNFIEAGSLLETNETTSVDLTKIYLEKIKEADELNCFNTVSAEQACSAETVLKQLSSSASLIFSK